MQGQIINTSVTGNQGVILGDDGVQYSFAATDWRDNSVKAASGMRVAFVGAGHFAMDVYRDQIVNYAVSAPPLPAGRITPAMPVHTAPRYAPPSVPNLSRQNISKTAVGLLYIFLGVVGSLIVLFYVGARMDARGIAAVVANVVFIVIFPIGFILWPIFIIVGIVFLCMSDEKFDEWLHNLRDHRYWNGKPENCLTGECFTPDSRRLRSIA